MGVHADEERPVYAATLPLEPSDRLIEILAP
jgi:hypothetical protein